MTLHLPLETDISHLQFVYQIAHAINKEMHENSVHNITNYLNFPYNIIGNHSNNIIKFK